MTETAKTILEPLADAALQVIVEKVTNKLGKTRAEELAPVIAQYGPAFAKMTSAEIWAWIDMAATKGDAYKSYSAIIAKLPNQELVNEWAAINQKMQTANLQNAEAIAWQRAAIEALLKALVAIAVSLVFI